MQNSKAETSMGREEALAALRADREAREQACVAEFEETLKRHTCILDAVPFIDEDGRIKARPRIIAK